METGRDNSANPILNQSSEDGFIDMTFRLTNLLDDGRHYRFRLTASYRESPVGMDVVVVKGIQGGIDPSMGIVKAHVYRNGVRFLRCGPESDRLVRAIAEMYAVAAPPTRMVDEETFTAIALHQGPLDMSTEPVKLKIFGKDGELFDEDAYYESFFNVDLANGFAYWNEKDPGYREPLLRALSLR